MFYLFIAYLLQKYNQDIDIGLKHKKKNTFYDGHLQKTLLTNVKKIINAISAKEFLLEEALKQQNQKRKQ